MPPPSPVAPPSQRIFSRRLFLRTGLAGAAGVALYSGELARHWLEVTELEIKLKNLPAGFEGVRFVQLSDIHLGEFTEDFFLKHAVEVINGLRADAVLLTGDFVTHGFMGRSFGERHAWPCAEILSKLTCPKRFAIMGNHDEMVGADLVTEALRQNGITVLRNSYVPLERGGGRVWLAGVDDVVEGRPEPDAAIPPVIRNQPEEPVVLLCHAPDYADWLLRGGAGKAASLMLSGHTHGGQIRIPFLPPFDLPPFGREYVEGLFRIGPLQLYVNRGLGTVGLPFRLNCPPEITAITLRRG